MTFLITKADLPDYTRLSPNIGDLLLNPAIRDAHTFDVLPLLREVEVANLAAYLQLPLDERGQHPAHVLYTTAVRPLLCYETYRRFMLDHGVHLTQNGAETISDVGHAPITGQQRTEIRADAAAKCAHYQAVLAGALRTYRGPQVATCGTSTNRRPSSGGLRTAAI